jgi:hypothetical protein
VDTAAVKLKNGGTFLNIKDMDLSHSRHQHVIVKTHGRDDGSDIF